MEDDERQHLDELSRTYRRRLRYLEQREALLGVSTPPEILIEAEDIRGKIDLIGQKLAPATASKVEVTETASTPTVPQLAERVVSASPNSSRVTISANTEAPVLTTASSGAVNNTNQQYLRQKRVEKVWLL